MARHFRSLFFLLLALVPCLGMCQTITAWGWNNWGQRTVPPGLSGVAQVAAGDFHNLALKSDGTVVAWGMNTFGQRTVPSGLSGVVQVAAGGHNSLALKSDGTVAAWGWNNYGQTSVPAGLSGVVQVAAGQSHSLALKSDGTVVAWGWNAYGQRTVPPGLSGVVHVAAGNYSSLALKSDGTVVAWGSNFFGETSVPAGLSGVVQVAAGGFHNLALKSDGTVVAWGFNAYGQTNVPPGLSGVVQVAAGFGHNLAVKSDGTVVAWGYNVDGQATVPADLSHVVQVAAGALHSLAIVTNGPPIADGGSDRNVVPTGVTTDVMLYGNGSSDPDNDVLTYQWRNDAGVLVSTDSTPVVSLPNGVHGFTLRVFDGKGLWDWDYVRISVQPRLSGFSLSRTDVVGGFYLKGIVQLEGAAPAPYLDVAISSDTPKKVLTTPVRMAGGVAFRGFNLRTYTVLATTLCSVTASYGGVSIARSVTLHVGGLSSFKVVPSVLVGGSSTTGTVKLSAPAPASSGGRTVFLVSKNPALVQVPDSVVIPVGSDTASFTITSSAVGSPTVVKVVATLGAVPKSVNITLNP